MSGNLATIEAERNSFDLETELVGLMKYGSPRVSLGRGGWHCALEMNTSAEGASFDVRSGFGMDSPLAAVLQCKERAKQAVATISKSV